MWVLIRRELEEMRVSSSRKESVISTMITGLVIILLMWLLGPEIFGVLDAKAITAFLAMIGLFSAGSGMNLSLEEDYP